MAAITISGPDLTVDLQGWERVWAFKSGVTVPLSHVIDANTDPDAAAKPRGWRGPGSYLPGVIIAGTFHHRGTREWWSVRDRKKTVVIDLRDERYRRLVVQVDDPEASAESIKRAISQP